MSNRYVRSTRRLRTAIIDITELHKAEQELHLLNEGLEQRVDARTLELRQRTDQLAAHSVELEKSQERFDLAIRGFANGIWDWPDVHQDEQWWSLRFYELLGYEPDEIEPSFSTFKLLLHPDDRRHVIAAAKAHWDDGIRYDIEYRLRTKSGHYQWFRVRADVLRDHHGNPKRMSGCLEDIQELRRNEEVLRLAVEVAGIDVFTRDHDAHVLHVLASNADLFNFELGQVVPVDEVFPLIHPDDRDEVLAAIQRSHDPAGDGSFSSEHRIVLSDGEVRWLWSCAQTYFEGKGKDRRPVRTVITAINLTEQKATELALRKEHDFSESVAKTAKTILLVLDADARILNFNPYFAEITGYDLSEIAGDDWFERMIPTEHRERGRAKFQQLLTASNSESTVTTIVTKNRHEREIEWFDTPLTDTNGHLIGLLCTGQDVTERLLLEREVVEIAGEEQRRIGHDIHDGLCQELTGLGLLAQGLADISSPNSKLQPTEERWQQFHEMARNLSADIGKTTGFARALAHGLVPVNVDERGLMSALSELVDSTNKVEQLRCKFELDGPIELLDNFVATHLYRIAQEAVSNALRHSGATEIVVAASDGDGVTLRISDNGQGLPEDDANSGFDHMGMRTMKYRADLIGATLEVQSESDSGTTVECTWKQR